MILNLGGKKEKKKNEHSPQRKIKYSKSIKNDQSLQQKGI